MTEEEAKQEASEVCQHSIEEMCQNQSTYL